MNNALKHAESSAIHLSLAERGNKLYFTFSDNGRGFAFNSLAHQNEGTRIEDALPILDRTSS